MKKSIHPVLQSVSVICANCKAEHFIISTNTKIKVEMCSLCHPFYTGEQKLIDTANKVKDFERRRNTAVERKAEQIPSKVRKSNKVTEIKTDRALTLRDMLKSVQGS